MMLMPFLQNKVGDDDQYEKFHCPNTLRLNSSCSIPDTILNQQSRERLQQKNKVL